MEFGFGVPTRGPLANPENIKTLAERGESLGYDIIFVSDHIIIPRDIDSIYPYSATGEFAGGSSGECLEQLSLLSYLAGITTTAKLLTSVMVLPHRRPVNTAKSLATIDVLSNGRVILGAGVGWMQEEFEAIDTAPYEARGAVSDEYIRAFKELWTSDDPTFEGKYVNFSNVTFAPKPVQKPHPPIWIGGESPPALRRAATLGDAWYPIGSNPKFPVRDAQEFAVYKNRIIGYAQEAGRDPSEIDFAYNANWYNGEGQTNADGSRRFCSGTPDDVAGDIKALQDEGVRHVMVNFQRDTLDDSLNAMEFFADKIKSQV